MTHPTLSIIAGAAALSAALAGTAQAQDYSFSTTRSELATPVTAMEVHERLRAEAETICADEFATSRGAVAMRRQARCVACIVEEVVAKIGHANLDIAHAATDTEASVSLAMKP